MFKDLWFASSYDRWLKYFVLPFAMYVVLTSTLPHPNETVLKYITYKEEKTQNKFPSTISEWIDSLGVTGIKKYYQDCDIGVIF